MLLLMQVINVFPQKPEITLHGSNLGNLETDRPVSQFHNKFKKSIAWGHKETQFHR